MELYEYAAKVSLVYVVFMGAGFFAAISLGTVYEQCCFVLGMASTLAAFICAGIR